MKKATEARHLVFIALAFSFLTTAVAHADTVYAAEEATTGYYGSGVIDAFDPSGNRTTFASGVYDPLGLAFDSNGNLYVACPSCMSTGAVLKFDPSGNQTTFATSGLNGPRYLAFDSRGNLYVSSSLQSGLPSTIMKYDPNGNGSLFAIAGG